MRKKFDKYLSNEERYIFLAKLMNDDLLVLNPFENIPIITAQVFARDFLEI